MVDLPHFSLPFRFTNGAAAVVEQDTTEEVAACVEAILRCPIGFRDELPEFGAPSPLFDQAPVPVEELRQAVAEWEPRASADFTEYGDTVDEAIRTVRIALDPQA